MEQATNGDSKNELSDEFVLVNSNEILNSALASQIIITNAALLHKLQTHQNRMNHISEFIHQRDIELEELRLTNQMLRQELHASYQLCNSLQKANAELECAIEQLKEAERKHNATIEELRENVRLLNVNVGVVPRLESVGQPSLSSETSGSLDSADNDLKDTIAMDVDLINAGKLHDTLCIVSKDWFDKHVAHVLTNFTEDTRPDKPNSAELYADDGQLRLDLEEDVDYTVLSLACYERLLKFYRYNLPTLHFSLIKQGKGHYQLDIPHEDNEVQCGDVIQQPLTIITRTMLDNSELIDDLQQQFQSIADAKLALSCQLDQCKVDQDALIQVHQFELEQINETVEDLRRTNIELMEQLKRYAVQEQKRIASASAKSSVPTCPICGRTFNLEHDLRIHASDCQSTADENQASS